MKRSASIALVTMASAALLFTSWEAAPDAEGEVFRDTDQCVGSGFVPDEDCGPLLEKGREIHKASAPRYVSQDLCEREHSVSFRASQGDSLKHGHRTCVQEQDGTNRYYSPSPFGYLVLGSLASTALSEAVRPVYSERDGRGYFMTGGGAVRYLGDGSYGVRSGNVRKYNPDVVQAKPRIQTRTTVASRSGFGSRAGGFGG